MQFNNAVKTYNSRQVKIAVGGAEVTGLADDTFVTIEQKGQGVISKSGCDGEVARAIDPNEQYVIRFVLLQTSDFNAYLQKQYLMDITKGTGLFPIEIRDMRGAYLFQAGDAWVSKQPTRTYGRDTTNKEWAIETGPATVSVSNYTRTNGSEGQGYEFTDRTIYGESVSF